MLQPHPSKALEYWFFKVNYQGTALLVDWICRRKTGAAVLRVSVHSPGGREVLFLDHPAILKDGAPELSMKGTSWSRGDVRWQLSLEASPARIRPQIFPAEQMKLFDMSLVSAPTVVFDGWIEHHNQRYPVVEARGMLSHYWGRGLPQEWWWISANQFDKPDISIECTILRSRVWGLPILVPLGYFYYRDRAQSRLLISPPARITAAGTPDAFEVRAGSLRGPQFALKAIGREYAALGDGIMNTLTGDLVLSERGKKVAHAWGSAALERRAISNE